MGGDYSESALALGRARASCINPIGWDEWAAELNRIAGAAFGRLSATDTIGASYFHERYFERGYSPAMAFLEDFEGYEGFVSAMKELFS
jgi:hypothetical protein